MARPAASVCETGTGSGADDDFARAEAAPATTASANDPLSGGSGDGPATTAFGRISNAVTGRFRRH